jgi:hypothetical protein
MIYFLSKIDRYSEEKKKILIHTVPYGLQFGGEIFEGLSSRTQFVRASTHVFHCHDPDMIRPRKIVRNWLPGITSDHTNLRA